MRFNVEFKDYLKTKALCDKASLEESLVQAEENSIPLHIVLIKNELLDERTSYEELANFLGIEYRTMQISEIDIRTYSKFPREKIIEYKVLPLYEDANYIYFMISNPFRLDEVNEFRYFTKKEIKVYLNEPSVFEELLSYADNKFQQQGALEGVATSEGVEDEDDFKITVDAPVIKLCDSILKDAVSRGASDIHIEPFESRVVLRFRIDGKLQIIDEIQLNFYQSILARYKIMAEMNIAERRVPQDGKINTEINGRKFDFRVSTIPTIFGEKLVIRIYDVTLSTSNIGNLGLNKEQEELVLNMITKPHGIILLTGPTGSGKSTSLYTFLRYLNKPDTNIITVEDPVENQIEGISQVQVNPKANLTFATALRSILRQDPNIIMIGEIRDEETAQIATRAAITGHLVFSTIHTNDSVGVVSRLINMGIPPYLVSDSLLGSISQRLVRKLCPYCKKEHKTTEAEMAILSIDKPATIYEPCGCSSCNNTGYSGRIGVFEIMVNNDEIRKEIMSPTYTSDSLFKVANVKPIILNARERVLNGETSISECEDLNDQIKM